MRVLIADDHELFRVGLTEMLTAHLSDSATYAHAHDLPSCLDCIDRDPAFDLILTDLDMPGMQGAESVAALVNKAGTTPVVVITASEDGADMVANVQAGAAGFIAKSMTAEGIAQALETILSGGYYITPGLGRSSDHPSAPAPEAHITERQRDILKLVEQGLTNKEIARELDLSPATVKAHVAALLTALQLKNRTQLAQVARNYL